MSSTDSWLGLWIGASRPEYRDRTSLVITADHGRGPAPLAWKDHGTADPGFGLYLVRGVGTGHAPLGERQKGRRWFEQAQVASTVAALVGEDFRAFSPGRPRRWARARVEFPDWEWTDWP
jgi:hypothetical protein